MEQPLTTREGQTQELCPGLLTLETRHEGKVTIYTFARRPFNAAMTSREVIDVWVKTIKEHVESLPPDTVWYRLHDFSITDMKPPPYLVAKLGELSKLRPDLQGYSAFAIPRNMFTMFIHNLARTIRPKHINIRLFFSREEALSWLDKQMKMQGAK